MMGGGLIALVAVSALQAGTEVKAAAAGREAGRVWAAGCTEKIEDVSRSELPHDGVWDEETGTVRIQGVRGEHVPFQLIVTAEGADVRGVTVAVTDLASGDASLRAEHVDLYYAHQVKVREIVEKLEKTLRRRLTDNYADLLGIEPPNLDP